MKKRVNQFLQVQKTIRMILRKVENKPNKIIRIAYLHKKSTINLEKQILELAIIVSNTI